MEQAVSELSESDKKGRIVIDAAYMRYVQGEDRGRAALLPAAVQDYVAGDASVRVIDAFKTIAAAIMAQRSLARVGPWCCSAEIRACSRRDRWRWTAPSSALLRAPSAYKSREIAEETARLDRRSADYLASLDEGDAREPDEAPSATAAALEALKARRAGLDRLAAQRDNEARHTLVEGEPDAGRWVSGTGRKPPSYNVLTAVDAAPGLISHHEVTIEPTDNRLLFLWRKPQRTFSASRA
jgi:hypothetical protein